MIFPCVKYITFTGHLQDIYRTFTGHLQDIYRTFTGHFHIDGASSRSFERHFLYIYKHIYMFIYDMFIYIIGLKLAVGKL